MTDTPPTKTIHPAEPEKSEQLCQQAQSEQVCQQAEMDQAGSSGSQVQQNPASPSGKHVVLGGLRGKRRAEVGAQYQIRRRPSRRFEVFTAPKTGHVLRHGKAA